VWLAFTCAGLNACDFSRSHIYARQRPLLPLGVKDVGVTRFGGGLVPIGKEHHLPIAILYALVIVSARRAALGIVVLRTAVNVVKWLGIIYRQFVKLRDGHIAKKPPVLAQIKRLVQPAVRAEKRLSFWLFRICESHFREPTFPYARSKLEDDENNLINLVESNPIFYLTTFN